MKNRHKARVYAFQFLYRLQLESFASLKEQLLDSADGVRLLPAIIEEFDTLMLPASMPKNEDYRFARKLVEVVLTRYSEIEKVCQDNGASVSKNRNMAVDYTILLLGTAEFISFPETHENIIINEMVELAKEFSTKDAFSYINRVLDSISKEVRR